MVGQVPRQRSLTAHRHLARVDVKAQRVWIVRVAHLFDCEEEVISEVRSVDHELVVDPFARL